MQNRLHVGDLTGAGAAGDLARFSAPRRFVVDVGLPKGGKAGPRRAFAVKGGV